MADPRTWFYGSVLGLPPGSRRPDFYTLLGLPFFKSDPETIAAAARERLRRVREAPAPDTPAHREAARAVCRDILAARETLIDARRREAYDAWLIGRGAGGT